MNEERKDQINYAIIKQIDSLKLTSNYGDIELSEKQLCQVKQYIEKLLEAELSEVNKSSVLS